MKIQHVRQLSLVAAAGFLALVGTSAFAQALTNRATDLRAQADDASRLIRALPSQTTVERLERAAGLWTRVKAGADVGYVRMMHIGGGATVVQSEGSSGGGVMSGFNRLLGGGSGGRKNEVATVGIRGFSKEDVQRASFNPAEFSKLKTYQASSSDIQRLASEGRLEFRSVAYLAQDAVAAAGGKS